MESAEVEDKGELGEAYVNQLAFASYLKYWCYPNPCDEYGDKKEICDLLICFGDTCIIISIKNYQFQGQSIQNKVERYKKKVVEKSSKQLYGAERKLFHSSHDIYIKHPDRDLEKFDKAQYKFVFRVTVSVGEEMEFYSLADDINGKGFISILNKDTVTAIIQELDTITDLTEYLKEREKLLSQNRSIIWSGTEKDILALYLRNARKFPEIFNQEFHFATMNLDGEWDNYNSHKSVLAKRDEDEQSYLIDRMVEKDVLSQQNGIYMAKELMRFSRLERRLLIKSWYEIIEQYSEDEIDTLGRRYTIINDTGYLFLYYPQSANSTEVDEIIAITCELYMYKFGQQKIIALGKSSLDSPTKYQMHLAPEEITPEISECFDKLIEHLGYFQNTIERAFQVDEYPDNS